MDTITYTALRANLANILDKVNEDHTPMLITRQKGEAAVVMSAQDFRAYEETAYLMASPRNAERLNQAITEIEASQTLQNPLHES